MGNGFSGKPGARYVGKKTSPEDSGDTLSLQNSSVTTAKIADSAVTTAKVNDAAITNAKLDKANIPLSGFGAAAAAVDIGSQLLTNVASGAAPGDGVNYSQLTGLSGRMVGYLKVAHVMSSGVAGGSASRGSWVNRTINTTVTNSISGASLAANCITLPAGTYFCKILPLASGVDQHAARLYDSTTTSILIDGLSAWAPGTGNTQNASEVSGQFVLSGTSALYVQCWYTAYTILGNMLGKPSSIAGRSEIYCTAEFYKVTP